MDVEGVAIDLLSTSGGNVDESCDASTSGNATARSSTLEHVATFGEPRNGMEFESKEAAYYFYREYARSVGFGITIKASRRSKRSGKFIDVKIACSRFGTTKRETTAVINPRSCPKTGCKAGLHMKRKEDERWVVNSFVKEHNHEICPDDFYAGVRGKKNKPGGAKKGLQLALEEEDIKLMLEHFADMQEKQPGFFYAVDLDAEKKRFRNVFWLDVKGKQDYCSFSDVVLFDAFYVRSGGCRIPFAPFVGVNRHRRYALLGCALIGEESESTYTWLFRTWVKAVGGGGRAPGVMITDQDRVLSDVVAQVLPSARHCFCLWDVVSRIHEMVDPFVSRDDGFTECFRNCVHGSWTDEQFERSWSEMIGKFELNENEWFNSLFNDRRKWAPHYFRGVCFAGLSGPERSGSIVSHFDTYMNSEAATFSDFFERYVKFLQYRYDVEAKDDDNDSQSKQPTLRSSLAFEKQLSLIYTDAAFKKFQAEVLGVVSCQLQKEREDETTAVFHVEDFEKRQNFFVAVNKELLDICCSCYLFEYQGFLCKHAILVLQNSDASCIPSQYILNRWSKKGDNREEKHGERTTVHNRMARFDDLCKRFVKLGEVGSLSDEAYKTALQFLEKNLEKCVSVNSSPKFPSEPERLITSESVGVENEGTLDCSSKQSRKKKTQNKRKASCGPEDVTNSSEELRQETVQVTSSAPTFGNCYIPQADIEGTELGSRAAAPLGMYYSSQQTIGFSSVSSVQDGYYGHPATIQAMGNLHSVHGRMNQYETQPDIQGAFQGQTGFRGSAIRGCYDMEETLHDMTMESSQFQGSGPSHPSDHRLSP
ncbi:protein FAR1-RELATED SEQUENCE 2 isoform X1 [Raphanus sativus]|uniref:Protein FAR1-RELATED SEQUENCE n=1 Tax=Raphanus sativus TaxID=3726 RepID=A0A6J0K205_RAPSA|nr:protein FAR1-RELATED SEQUENCE 2 isoform X1 [Raphanus sativus]XP_018441038.1 protein FAR1-RELATED SEQUENCE 2 isoform X1 [Raphanus sativus]XP_018441039.1 protein FAR1-RELATED SEQUENCE 2 isoform X1 [Raphanus sativus]XP_018441040.1 protein FAR1-RELATED SEQUENCE 2 isoform X1 [Raphanus sativus]